MAQHDDIDDDDDDDDDDSFIFCLMWWASVDILYILLLNTVLYNILPINQ